MAKEDSGNGIGSEAGDNRVKKCGGVGKGITAIVTREDMANDPGTLVLLLAGFQLFNQVFEDAGLVRIGEIEVVEDVVNIPLTIALAVS